MEISIIEPLEVPKDKVMKAFESLEANVEYYSEEPSSRSELIKRCRNSEIIVLVNHDLPKEVIEKLDSTELIAVSFTGYDHVDIEAAKKNGVAVTNVPEYATSGVVELVFGLMISVLRRIRACDKEVRGRIDVDRRNLKGEELKNKKLGVIGTGKIGSEVARVGNCFGMDIYAFSRNKNEEITDFVEYVSFEKLLRITDILSLHVPLTEETESLIGERELELMKNGSVVINAARADVIDKEAFVDAVRSQRIFFGLDVPHKNLPQDVRNSEKVIFTPHVGYYTKEALKRRLKTTVDNIEAFVRGEEKNRVI